MKSVRKKRFRFAIVACAAVAGGAFAVTGPASAGSDRGVSIDATIKAKFTNGKVKFAGPKTISRFGHLEIVNDTNPEEIGPHTFSLVQKGKLPKTRKQFRKCGRLKLPVCLRIVKAHDANPETGEVNKRDVDLGREGWDKPFGKKRGDSWFTDIAEESTVRRVTAPAGKVLTYFCVVHPDMRGKLKVTPAVAPE